MQRRGEGGGTDASASLSNFGQRNLHTLNDGDLDVVHHLRERLIELDHVCLPLSETRVDLLSESAIAQAKQEGVKA